MNNIDAWATANYPGNQWPFPWAGKGARVRVRYFNDVGQIRDIEGGVRGYEFRGAPMILVFDGRYRHDIYRDRILKLEPR